MFRYKVSAHLHCYVVVLVVVLLYLPPIGNGSIPSSVQVGVGLQEQRDGTSFTPKRGSHRVHEGPDKGPEGIGMVLEGEEVGLFSDLLKKMQCDCAPHDGAELCVIIQ